MLKLSMILWEVSGPLRWILESAFLRSQLAISIDALHCYLALFFSYIYFIIVCEMADGDTTVKVAVRIRPLNEYEALQDGSNCLDVVHGQKQVRFLYLKCQKIVRLTISTLITDQSRRE
jgi:hypothetical protein